MPNNKYDKSFEHDGNIYIRIVGYADDGSKYVRKFYLNGDSKLLDVVVKTLKHLSKIELDAEDSGKRIEKRVFYLSGVNKKKWSTRFFVHLLRQLKNTEVYIMEKYEEE